MSEEALQRAEKRREAKGKREKERYTHVNENFQRIARRDKKGFLSDQSKELKRHEVRRGAQGASRVAPGKSGLHVGGEGL